MVLQVIRRLLDDLTGEENAATHRIAIDDLRFEVDLTPANFDQLMEVFKPYADAGRATGRATRLHPSTKRTTSTTNAATRPPKQRTELPDAMPTREIRAWWKANYRRFDLAEPKNYGRVPDGVVDAWRQRNNAGIDR